MSHISISRFVATGIATGIAGATIAGSAFAAAPGAQASPATSRVTQAAATAQVRQSRMDIDGDGRADLTTLRRVRWAGGVGTYSLSTRTARGTTSYTTFRVEDNGEDIKNVWCGVGGLDGVRGAEIVVNPSPVGDGDPLEAYTWRKGMLVKLPAAGAPRAARYQWLLTNMPWGVHGYTFSTKKGVRYVTKHDLVPYQGKIGRYTGTHTTYRWTTKGWAKVSTAKAGIVSDRVAQDRYAGFNGITLR